MTWQAPTSATLFAAMDETWAPAAIEGVGGWAIRKGNGGGKRVSAASKIAPDAQVDEAVLAMERLGQAPLFMIRPDEGELDRHLEDLGYDIVDPVVIRAGQVATIVSEAKRNVIEGDFPLAMMAEIWAAGGIGPGRLAVMSRVAGPKSYLLARDGDFPAGVGFVALTGDIAMLHAVEVLADRRRTGVGRAVTLQAAAWGARHGAQTLALAVTRANTAANALYDALGLKPLTAYHYRLGRN